MTKKILLVSNSSYFRIYGNAFEKSVHDLNCLFDFFLLDKPTVTCVTKHFNKSVVISGLLSFCLKKNNFLKRIFYKILRSKFQQIAQNYTDIVFINVFYDGEYFINKTVAQSMKKPRTIVYFVDTAKNLLKSPFSFVNSIDKWASFERSDISFLKDQFNIDAEFIPTGNTYYLYPHKKEITRRFDVGFVGLATPKRLKYLEEVARFCKERNLNLFIAGHFWHNSNFLNDFIGRIKFSKKYKFLSEYVKNSFINPKDVANIYCQTKIVLSINIESHKTFNPRNFDVMICGCLLITDCQDPYGTPAIKNRDYIECHNEIDMVKSIDKFLSNSQARETISLSGQTKSQENCFSKTVSKILEPFD